MENRGIDLHSFAWLCLAAGGLAVWAGGADARPLRGPLLRAERRVVRAQAALDRELARPPVRGRVVERGLEPGPAATTAAAPGAASPARPATSAATALPPTAARAAEPRPASAPRPEPEVARAGYESPVPPAAAGEPRSAPARPAADGTVSVLVRPGSVPATPPAAQERSVEPLRFPEASKP